MRRTFVWKVGADGEMYLTSTSLTNMVGNLLTGTLRLPSLESSSDTTGASSWPVPAEMWGLFTTPRTMKHQVVSSISLYMLRLTVIVVRVS